MARAVKIRVECVALYSKDLKGVPQIQNDVIQGIFDALESSGAVEIKAGARVQLDLVGR